MISRILKATCVLLICALPVIADGVTSQQTKKISPALLNPVLGPVLTGVPTAGLISLTGISFYNPNTNAWVPAVYNVQNGWTAPAGSQGWAIQFTGNALPVTGGGTIVNTAVINGQLTTNTGIVGPTCVEWNQDGSFSINYNPNAPTDLQPVKGVMNFVVWIDQQWPNNPREYTTMALGGVINWPANN